MGNPVHRWYRMDQKKWRVRKSYTVHIFKKMVLIFQNRKGACTVWTTAACNATGHKVESKVFLRILSNAVIRFFFFIDWISKVEVWLPQAYNRWLNPGGCTKCLLDSWYFNLYILTLRKYYYRKQGKRVCLNLYTP